jgi:hypothetical protein
MHEIRLRQANDQDVGFLWQLHRAALSEHVAQTSPTSSSTSTQSFPLPLVGGV